MRGGVIGGSIIALLTILSASCLYFFGFWGSWGLECIPFTFFLTILDPIYTFITPSFYALPSTKLFLIDILTYLLLGSLVGALVGYIKKRKGPK